MFSMIECTKKCAIELPFGVRYDMPSKELDKLFGQAKQTNFMNTLTSVWRKTFQERYEIIVSDNAYPDSTNLRTITIGFVSEQDLYTMEDYAKQGL
jgi:hypothetical protein